MKKIIFNLNKITDRDFPDVPVAKTVLPVQEARVLIPGQETRSHTPQLRVCLVQLSILRATTKTRHSQINKIKNFKKQERKKADPTLSTSLKMALGKNVSASLSISFWPAN